MIQCRVYKEAEETVDRIYTQLLQTDYKWHSTVTTIIPLNICKNYNLQVVINWWEHRAEKAVKLSKLTYGEISKYKLIKSWLIIHKDLTVVEKKVWLIDVVIPAKDRELEKITKYQDLKIKTKRLWHKLVMVVPVVIGIQGTIPKNLWALKENPICQLQRATLLGSVHMLHQYITTF